MTASPRVAVIGGGLAGLTVARQLNLKSPARAVDVEVFEASDSVGGVIQTTSADGFIRESAANGVLGSARGGGADLASDLGIAMVAASPSAKKRWIYVEGRLQALPADPLGLAKTRLLSTRGKLRLLGEPVRSMLPGEPTVAEFFRHRLGDEVHDRIVAPFVAGIYAGDTEELSMPAAFPRVSEIASHGGLLRGMLGEGLAARRRGQASGGGRQTSAPAGGMGVIVKRLADKLAGRIRLGESIERVERSSRGVDIATSSGRIDHFDAVVCAVPAYAAAPMFHDADAELAELLAMIPTAPVAVVHLGYRRADVGHPLDGFGFLAAPSEGLDVLGVVFESSIWPSRAPDDTVLLRVMIGGRLRADLIDRTDDELVELARDNCGELLAIRGEPVHENLVRWPRAIAQYTVGHRDRLERAELLAADQGVVLAGASYHGVAVNSVTGDAARVARRVHEILAAPLAVALWLFVALALSACSGTEKTRPADPNGDGGQDAQPVDADDAGVTEVAPSTAFASGYSIAELDAKTSGSIEVRVIAPSPPARFVDAGDMTACNKRSRAPLRVHTLGGVRGVVVWLEGVERGRAKTTPVAGARQTLKDCQIKPRVAVVGRLDAALQIVTASESPRALSVEFGASSTSLAEIARLPMAPIGRGFRIPAADKGVYRTRADGVDGAWAVVADNPYIALTKDTGTATLAAVPVGSYQLHVWHPPVGGAPLTSVVPVNVEAGKPTKISVDLSSQLAAIKAGK